MPRPETVFLPRPRRSSWRHPDKQSQKAPEHTAGSVNQRGDAISTRGSPLDIHSYTAVGSYVFKMMQILSASARNLTQRGSGIFVNLSIVVVMNYLKTSKSLIIYVLD